MRRPGQPSDDLDIDRRKVKGISDQAALTLDFACRVFVQGNTLFVGT
jgi:hypothetical protein